MDLWLLWSEQHQFTDHSVGRSVLMSRLHLCVVLRPQHISRSLVLLRREKTGVIDFDGQRFFEVMELKVKLRPQREDNKYREVQRDGEFRHLQSESRSDVSPEGATLIPAGEMLECFQFEEPEAERGS